MRAQLNHQTHPYFISSPVPITVNLIGCGGTGSEMLLRLAKIDQGLLLLGRAGLFVRVWDFDKLEYWNVGKQRFYPTDVGRYKAEVLVERVNRAYGTQWEAHIEHFTPQLSNTANITISCVDDISTREHIHQFYKKHPVATKGSPDNTTHIYWLDTGNGKNFGQGVLGGNGLDTVLDKHPEILQKVNNNEPSCSYFESLQEQSFFINETIAMHSGMLIWDLLVERAQFLDYHSFYTNLRTGQTTRA